ncbi:FAD-binding oxidoreductase [Arthrobacter sp. RHLT1-20]
MTPARQQYALIDDLVRAVGAANVLSDPEMIEGYRRDMQPLAGAGIPSAVVRPASTDEVVEVVNACRKHGVPMVPRGAGSGVTAAANAVDGAVTIVTSRMNTIEEINPESGYAVVQPGVVTQDLMSRAKDIGMFYTTDPTSSDWSTIGGNLANGSGGPRCAKYGATGDAVLGLEIVLASGDVLDTSRRTIKGVSGYDLNHLFVGSEGTLGIITKATLRLRRKPPKLGTAVAAFSNVQHAALAVADFISTGYSLSLLEVMDEACFGAVKHYLGSQLLDDGGAPAAVLFAQSDTGTTIELDAFAAAAAHNGALLSHQTDDESEGETLMGYLRGLGPALDAKGSWILHEVTVPRQRIADLIQEAKKISVMTDLFVGVHGHAQDGTLHPMIVFPSADPGAKERARTAYELILQAAIELGGPVTGEHGIRRMKVDHLEEALGQVGLQLHRAIKSAFDPRGLFNPGAMFSYTPEESK